MRFTFHNKDFRIVLKQTGVPLQVSSAKFLKVDLQLLNTNEFYSNAFMEYNDG